jgi:hypothetical protein
MALWNFMDLPCALGTGFVHEAHERFQKMQNAVMGDEDPPSDRVIDEHNSVCDPTTVCRTKNHHKRDLRLRQLSVIMT